MTSSEMRLRAASGQQLVASSEMRLRVAAQVAIVRESSGISDVTPSVQTPLAYHKRRQAYHQTIYGSSSNHPNDEQPT